MSTVKVPWDQQDHFDLAYHSSDTAVAESDHVHDDGDADLHSANDANARPEMFLASRKSRSFLPRRSRAA